MLAPAFAERMIDAEDDNVDYRATPTSRSPTFTNRIVALSNLVIGIPYAVMYWSKWSWLAIAAWLIVLAASFLMHISETRRGLPGVQPFNRWATEFLWFDRSVAMLAGGWVALQMLLVPGFFDGNILLGIVGLVALAISQGVPTLHPDLFIATHCLWHLAALVIFALSLPRS